MNSALKPLSQPGVPQGGGQASPAKANVATANHAVGLPQGAQNSLHHASNSLVGQNLIHHVPNTPQLPPHAAPSMAPVSANMAQMAQNMSHHGNLSHPLITVSPSKAPSTSAPLSLVADKVNPSQPLALTRTPEKKEPDSSSQANGTVESPKPSSNSPAVLKAQNPESNKDKQDIAKTSPSTPKPPEKPSNAPATPQKSEASNPVAQADGPAQPKVATANEAPEKSPSKPIEMKPAQTADVAPTQSDNKPVPESANDSQDKPPSPQKPEPSSTESAKVETPVKLEEKEEPVVDKPEKKEEPKEEVKEEKVEAAKPEEVEPPKPQKQEEKIEEKKVEPKPVKPEVKVTPKSTLKLATVTPPMRKRRQVSDKSDGATPSKKGTEGDSTPDARTKRNRTKVQLYQSPTPEIAMATKLSASAGRSTPTKQNDDKLIVFYKNEYLAVRNAEGGFYVCQAMQNVYRTTRKIKIRWLSQDKSDSSGETYKPDFYDVTDMECVLTTLSVTRAAGGAQRLSAGERARATSILQRALRAEQGAAGGPVTEEHPDGLDLSLYTDESQLEKKSRKRTSSKASPKTKDEGDSVKETPSPSKRAKPPARRGRGAAPPASASKTATAVTDKKPKSPKRTPTKAATKVVTPVVTPRKGRRAGKERKSTPIVPTPSTSTGKSTRTPRKPPAKK